MTPAAFSAFCASLGFDRQRLQQPFGGDETVARLLRELLRGSKTRAVSGAR